LSEPAFDELLPRPSEAGVEFVLIGGPFSIEAELASGEQMTIETDLGKLDVVQGLDGVLPYAELRPRASEAEVLGVKVAVCSREDLMAMKRAAGRPRDLVDLEDLDAAADD
jgi:hypothetical protein